jgi:hypothetical protein
MKRAAVIAGVVALGVAAYALWPSPSPVVETPEEKPQFEAVEVRANGSQGLTLTGIVRDPSGQPVANAQVFLAAASQTSLSGLRCGVCNELLLSCHADESARSVAGLLEKKSGEQQAALTTTSDAEGKFRFEQLAGTSFTVWGRAPGFGDGVKERTAPGDPVELILPTVRSLNGLVRDEAGQPVVGATLRVTSRRLPRVLEMQSDAEGKFTFSELGEGPFVVSAVAPGKLPALARNVEAGGQQVALTLKRERTLEVRTVFEGKPIDASVAITGEHLSRQLAAKNGLLSVRSMYPGEVVLVASVKDLASMPTTVMLTRDVTQVTLTLERGGTIAVTVMDEADQPVEKPELELRTRGQELITKKKAGTGDLVVFGPLGVGDYQLFVSATGYAPQFVPVKIVPGETPIEVTLSKGTLISGQVVDEYGRPANGVAILVSPTGDSIVSGADGKFTAQVPSPGLYELHAHHSDWGGGDVKVQAPKEGVTLQLEPRAGALITVTADGRRVEGASVTLYHSAGNFRSDRVSGADGVVLMRGLPPDSYTLIATHPDFLQSERQQIELHDGDQLKISAELKRGGKIEGQVVDTDGAPVEAVSIAVSPRGAEPATTDAQGKFELSPLKPGTAYSLRVVSKAVEQLERSITWPDKPPVKIVVKRHPVFRGRVLGEGTPLKSFRIDDHEVTSPDGTFEVPLSSTPDHVLVSIDAPGYEPMIADRPNKPDLGDFDLTRAPQITGVVKDDKGAGVVDAVVSCDTCEQSVLSGSDGKFSIGKPPYTREFVVSAKKGRRGASKTITGEPPASLELVLRPGVKVSGTAYMPNGQPAAGLEIGGVNTDRGETVSVVTNGDGTYSMEVSPGIYRFMLTLPPVMSEEPPAIITEISGTEQRLDFGPVPGLASLNVQVPIEPGYALWLVRGEVSGVANPPMELLHASWAQLIYQPLVEHVTLGGLMPGRYTLIWASFHATMPNGPKVMPIDVPAQGEVKVF